MPATLIRTAALHLALFAICLVLYFVDEALVMRINRWIKPMKFMLSIAIYLGTLAWIWPVAVISPAWKSAAEWILCLTMIGETVCVLMQAARGVTSHYNNATAFDGAVFTLMGILIITNIAMAAVVLAWTFRSPPSPYVWGVRLGLLLFVLFGLEGGVMVARLQHAVGVPDGGPGLPFVNWSRTGGDLRVAHFVGLHALQVLPILGRLTDRVEAVWVGFGIWATLAGFLLVRALNGVPLLR